MFKKINSCCILCNCDSAYLLTDKLRFDINKEIHQCKDCKLVYMYQPFAVDSDTTFYEDEYRRFYNAPPPEEFFNYQQKEALQQFSRIKPNLKPNYKILEIGSAAGNLLNILQKSNYTNIEGIELDKNYSQFAIDKFGLRIYQKPLENIDIRPESYDVILSFHVLEHFSNPVAVLKNASNLLKPKGLFIAEVPNIDDYLISIMKLKSYKDFYFQPAHNFYFSPKTIKMVFSKAGFVNINIKLVHRYSLFNGINWIRFNKPSGIDGGSNENFLNSTINYLFKNFLILIKKTDTLIVFAQKNVN